MNCRIKVLSPSTQQGVLKYQLMYLTPSLEWGATDTILHTVENRATCLKWHFLTFWHWLHVQRFSNGTVKSVFKVTVGQLFSMEYNFRVFWVNSQNLLSRKLCLVQFDLAKGWVHEIWNRENCTPRKKTALRGLSLSVVAHCVCTYIFLRFFGLLGPGNNGCVKVSDRDSKKRSRRSEMMEDGMNDECCISVSLCTDAE